jgi:hypothetical protein
MPKTRKPKDQPEQEELFNDDVRDEHADGQVSDAASEEEEVVHEQTEEEVLTTALINLGHNEVYSEAQARVKKLTKQERAMLLERVSKPPE